MSQSGSSRVSSRNPSGVHVRAPGGELLEEEERQKIEAYTRRLLANRNAPKPSPEERAESKQERLRERLERTEARLDGVDRRRMRLLIEQAKLHADRGHAEGVYACAVELAHLAHTVTLGVQRAHPVLAPGETPAVRARGHVLPPGGPEEL